MAACLRKKCPRVVYLVVLLLVMVVQRRLPVLSACVIPEMRCQIILQVRWLACSRRRDSAFLFSARIAHKTRFSGSVWEITLSEDAGQKYLFVADGTNIDSEGNLYTGKADNGKRVQKFVRKK